MAGKKIAWLLLFGFLLLFTLYSIDPVKGEGSTKASFCDALLKVEASTVLWTGEGYGEKYNEFSKALLDAYATYRKDPSSAPSSLLDILDEYRDAREFWRAYLDDQVVLWRSMRSAEPTYRIGIDRWPARLEARFPGLLEAVGEKDSSGEMYISGQKALDYILARIRTQVKAAC